MEITRREKKHERNQAGDDRRQKDRLAANAVCEATKGQLHRHRRERVDPEEKRDLKEVHATVSQGQSNNGDRQSHRKTVKELVYLKHANVPSR